MPIFFTYGVASQLSGEFLSAESEKSNTKANKKVAGMGYCRGNEITNTVPLPGSLE